MLLIWCKFDYSIGQDELKMSIKIVLGIIITVQFSFRKYNLFTTKH